jgi:CBS domain-containing protein
MAERERSLDLDLETVGYGEKAQRVARIAVVGTEGCTRDGSASTITLDCRSASTLAREVDRLREELEDALARAQSELEDASGGGARPRAAPARAADRPAAAHRPRLTVQATVADAMTREVRTVAANDRLSSAKAAMDEGGFRHLVVLGRDGEVEGVLSHRDLFFGPLAWSMGQGKQGYQTLLEASRVKEVMQTEVETISPSAPLQQAAERMRERRIGCLPVVEADRLVGLITEGDLVSLIAEASAESEPAR